MRKHWETNIISFYELKDEWQDAARDSNENCEELLYLEPQEHLNPTDHVLCDLHECMYLGADNFLNLPVYTVPISNNSALMFCCKDDDLLDAEIIAWYV